MRIDDEVRCEDTMSGSDLSAEGSECGLCAIVGVLVTAVTRWGDLSAGSALAPFVQGQGQSTPLLLGVGRPTARAHGTAPLLDRLRSRGSVYGSCGVTKLDTAATECNDGRLSTRQYATSAPTRRGWVREYTSE